MRKPIIYIVDDEEINRIILREVFKRHPYEVHDFAGGHELLAAMQKQPPDLLLLDVMMPDLDGYQVCEIIRRNSDWDDIPVIFVTAAATRDNLYQGLQTGGVDYLLKPIDKQEMRLRVEQHLRQRSLHRQVKEQKERMEREIRTAQKIQYNLLPLPIINITPTLEFTYSYIPCETMAGDFLDCFTLDKDNWLFYMADVSGHGLASALVTVFIKQFFRRWYEVGRQNFNLQDALKQLNHLFLSIDFNNMALTLFLGVLHAPTATIDWAFAGANARPMLINEEGIEVLNARGEAVGWFAKADWDVYTTTIQPGQCLFLYSDAAVEIRNADHQELGEAGLVELIKNVDFYHSKDFFGIMNGLREFSGETRFVDDLTMIALENKIQP